MMRPYHTISTEDVGQPWLKIFGQLWIVSEFMGRILPGDVGKRIYLVGRILQVENDEQRDRRLQGVSR